MSEPADTYKSSAEWEYEQEQTELMSEISSLRQQLERVHAAADSAHSYLKAALCSELQFFPRTVGEQALEAMGEVIGLSDPGSCRPHPQMVPRAVAERLAKALERQGCLCGTEHSGFIIDRCDRCKSISEYRHHCPEVKP